LLLQDPSGKDGGTYRCHVKNDYGESNANLNLNIESEADLDGNGPTFVEKPRITSERNGKLVIMEFKVKADPKPTIVWSREGTVIKETVKLKMFMTQSSDVYHIRLELTVSI
jgi:Immunoglobulin I-set domain